MTEVCVATEIAAPAGEVWRVLTDLSAYRRWNPFIRRARGSLAVGGTVRLRVRTSRRIPLAFHAVIADNVEQRLLRWRGSFLRSWLGAGEHEFVLEPLGPERTRLTQRERFTGILPWLARRVLAGEVERGFAAMNGALAARAEGVRDASR
jgi:hypothetical protein